MSDTFCDCCNQHDGSGEPDTSPYVIDDSSPLDVSLPNGLQSALEQFAGSDSIETLHDWAMEIRQFLDTDSITLDVLCHADTQTEHWGVWNDERYYFACFYDAVILAAIDDEPIDVRTLSPSGDIITAQAVGGETLIPNPTSAVFSFGIATSTAVSSGESPSLAAGYEAICPYVHAFIDESHYRSWATASDAATVAMPLDGATDLARRLTR